MPIQLEKYKGLEPAQLETLGKIALKLAQLGQDVEFHPPVTVGPVLSVYRFSPLRGTKVSDLESLSDDIAIALGVSDVLIKRMPGETTVGFYVPNKDRQWIDFKDAVSAVYTAQPPSIVPLALGVDHLGVPVVEDLVGLPHLLIAGQTGGGKSTLLASILAACVYKVDSNAVQFILSDTKGVEFGYFLGAPHLLFPPATTVMQTLEQLQWAVEETQRRLDIIGKAGCRNITEYTMRESASPMPRIVIVIDELADLLGGEFKKQCKEAIASIVQRSRAAGVHLIASTQRPSVKIIDGDIKANFPARIALKLPSGIDSRTILNTTGAEHLIAPGDMLYLSPNQPGIRRIHAPYAKITDIQAAVDMACRREGI